MSRPSKTIRPDVESSSLMMQRASVDFPQPDSPTIPSVSPSLSVKLTAVDRLHRGDLLLEDDPAGDREVLLDVVDDEELVACELGAVPVRLPAGCVLNGSLSARLPAITLRPFAVLRLLVEVAAYAMVADGSREHGSSSGSVSLQIGITYGQRGWKRQPAGGKQQRRRLPGDLDEPLDVLVQARQRAEQAPRVRMVRPAGRESRTSPSSWMRAAYMTTTSSAISATTPRSCVIMMIALPNSSWRRFIRSRICACVVTSSAVVGSSAISRSGLLTSAIAIITRWRIPPENWCG